jgi:hypothetical protein
MPSMRGWAAPGSKTNGDRAAQDEIQLHTGVSCILASISISFRIFMNHNDTHLRPALRQRRSSLLDRLVPRLDEDLIDRDMIRLPERINNAFSHVFRVQYLGTARLPKFL